MGGDNNNGRDHASGADDMDVNAGMDAGNEGRGNGGPTTEQRNPERLLRAPPYFKDEDGYVYEQEYVDGPITYLGTVTLFGFLPL